MQLKNLEMQLHSLQTLDFYLLLPLSEGCNKMQYVTSSKWNLKKYSNPHFQLLHVLYKGNNTEQSADGAVLIMDFSVSSRMKEIDPYSMFSFPDFRCMKKNNILDKTKNKSVVIFYF